MGWYRVVQIQCMDESISLLGYYNIISLVIGSDHKETSIVSQHVLDF
jgi:hypothetical protein